MGKYVYISNAAQAANESDNYHFCNATLKKGGYWVVKVGIFR
jgi:hypothetical protein